MVTADVVFALIGSLLFKSAISASINYEPIKITVNENFNAQPGQVSTELQALEPGVLLQGANFYFKPQLNLPQSLIPSHMEALISLIQQHHHSCTKDASKVVIEKDKLIEVLQPFMFPVSEISKKTLSEKGLEEQNNLEIVTPLEINSPALEKNVTEPLPVIITEESRPVTQELLVIPEAPMLPQISFNNIPAVIEREVKNEESVILEEPTGEFSTIPEIAMRPIMEPFINYVEPKVMTSELVNIPEAPVLPSLSKMGIPPNIEEEIEKEETVIVEGQRGVFPTIPETAVRPTQEPIINNVEPKPINTKLEVMPEAPVLPPLSANDIKLIEDGVKFNDHIVVNVESKPINSELEAMPEAPVLPPLSANDIKLIEDGVKYNKPIVVDDEFKAKIQEYLVIPEAPVLPLLSIHDIPSIKKEEVKKEESIIFGEATEEIPTIPEIAVRPITKPIINYVEPKVIASGLVNIPEAPVLPSLSKMGIPPNIEEEIEKEETVIVEGQRGVFPTIPETAVRPSQEPIINNFEPKPINTELDVMPEAPVLPPLSANDIKLIEDGVKFNEHIVVNVESKPINSELEAMPEAPVLPPLSANDIKLIEDGVKYNKPIVVDDEFKAKIQEYLVIPEAPVLPLLSIHDIPSIKKEEVKKEESIIFGEATEEIPTIPEIAVRPITKPIINYVEPKVIASGLVNIPEAPVLPSLSKMGIPPNIEEEIEKEETVIVEGQRGVFPTIPETAVRPSQEPIINNVEPKPINTELDVMPEAPVLPPLSANDIKLIEDGVKFNEHIVVNVESKPINSELEAMPEAPVLPPLSANDIKLIKDGVKYNKPIVVDDELKAKIQEYLVIPEAPVLPLLSIHDIPSIEKEEVKKEESIIFGEATEEIPTIPEIAVRPITKPIINYVEPKVIASGLVNIPEAPVLPSLSKMGIPPNIEEEIEKEETVIVEGQRGVFPTIPETAVRPSQEPIINNFEPKPINTELDVMPEAPVLPPLSANDIKLIEDGVKFNEHIVVNVESKPINSELEAMPEAPVLPPLSANDIKLIKDGVKYNKPIVVDDELKAKIQEYLVIPEAPVLPLLSIHDIPSIEKEEVKKEESIIFGEATGEIPTIPEIAVRPITKPIINYVEPKVIASGLVNIPEAQVLPSLSKMGIPPNIEEEIEKEETVIVEGQRGVFPTIPETAVRPSQEPIINNVEPKPINTELEVMPEAPVLPPLSANDIKLIEDGVKYNKPIVVDHELKAKIQEYLVIPEAPVLPPPSLYNVPSFVEEKVGKEESTIFEEPNGVFSAIPEIAIRPIQKPINYVEPKAMPSELGIIPEAPILPPLSLNSIPSFFEEAVKEERSLIMQESTKVSVGPITEPNFNYDEPKSTASKLGVIPKAPVLPPLLAKGIHVIEEEVKSEGPVDVDVEPRPFISNHIDIPEVPLISNLSINMIQAIGEKVKTEESIKNKESTGLLPSIPEIFVKPIPKPIISETVESFALENNIFPVATEEIKIEVPILLEETIELFPPVAEISSGPPLETIQESEMTYSYQLDEVSEPNPENVVTVKETLPPTIIPKPTNNLGVFSYAPFVSHLSNRASKTNKLTIAKPASLERFLLKKHPFRLPLTPFPKLCLNEMEAPKWGNKKQFFYPTSYAHDVVEKRIAPNMAFKKNAPPKRVKIYIRSQVPKGPSYL